MKNYSENQAYDTYESSAINKVDNLGVYQDEDCIITTDDSTFRPAFLPREEKNAADLIWCIVLVIFILAILCATFLAIGSLCHALVKAATKLGLMLAGA